MEITCLNVSEIGRTWAETGKPILDPVLRGLLREHLHACASCAAAYRPLLPFIFDDARHSGLAGAEGFTDRVMRRLREPAAAESRYRGVRLPRRPVALRGAAAALLIAAFSLGFWAGGASAGRPSDFIDVRFALEAPSASRVELVGLFRGNDLPVSTEMTRGPDGLWRVSLRLKKNSVYTYSFLVDGSDIVPDPSAEEFVDDGFGGRDSLLRL